MGRTLVLQSGAAPCSARLLLLCRILVAIVLLATAEFPVEGAKAKGAGKRLENLAIQILPASSGRTGQAPVQGYKLSPDKYVRAIAYRRAGYWLYFITAAYGFLLLLLMLHWRIAPRVRDWTERVSSNKFVRLLLFAPTSLVLFSVLLSPTDAYAQWLSLKYSQSVQSWGSWLWDWSTGEALTVIFGTLLIGLLYLMIWRSPRRWWLYFWLAALPIAFFAVFLEPVLIDPLFNKFEALDKTHPELVDSVQSIVGRAGLTIPRERVFLMKASEKTNELDAYVTGFGGSKRVVIFDTIIAAEPGAVILHTLGHEMGHYVLNHYWIAFVVLAPAFLGLFYLIDRLLKKAVTRWGPALQVRDSGDLASLPLLSLIIFVISFLLTPVSNALSRYEEHEADRYGLEVIHGIVPNPGEVAARAFQVEGETNLSDPNPPEWIKFWLFDHPSTNDRIIFCRTYDPWSNGEKPKYVQ
jgi:Zn-dependent protease with chaperone function